MGTDSRQLLLRAPTFEGKLLEKGRNLQKFSPAALQDGIIHMPSRRIKLYDQRFFFGLSGGSGLPDKGPIRNVKPAKGSFPLDYVV